jgi:energy-coupling factor transporter ATP-binding protein EcfA2
LTTVSPRDTNIGVRLVLKRWKRYKNPLQDAMPLAAVVLKDLKKYCPPPPRTGIRAYLQPFERATGPALRGVTFEVQEGEALALLGANGVGKSTILRILATRLIPRRGQALVSGQWLQLIAKLNSMTHALNAMRAALLNGAGLPQITSSQRTFVALRDRIAPANDAGLLLDARAHQIQWHALSSLIYTPANKGGIKRTTKQKSRRLYSPAFVFL